MEFIEFLGCVYFCLSSNMGSFQKLFLQIFFCPFLFFFFLNSYVFVVTLDSAPQSLRLCSFFFSLFFLLTLFSIALSSNLMIISSSSKLLLNASKMFHSSYRISVWLLLIISVSVLIFSFCLYCFPDFLSFFLSIFSFSSLYLK